MKLNCTNYPAPILGVLLALSAAQTQAGTMGPIEAPPTEKIYFGVFGGGGSSNHVNLNQYGTAFFPEASGGPLAVNAFGHTNRRDVGIVGGHIGYQWGDVLLKAFNSQTSLSPAVELEGYYIGKSSFTGHEINNETFRLSEHDFLVTYPTTTGVFLANTVLNFNLANYTNWHPYVAGGIGAAVLSISNANALQVAPLEANVNHYNGNTKDNAATFAAQTKVGLSFSYNDHLSLFAEYRWLYTADTNFTFGSTIYPTHAATSSWNTHFGAQYYNMGAAGIRFII